ncbi:BON domain-containing protein [Comamonas granuli]|uniref:BON domain-containing protein n=1 Tax=Comamonas granuli TaxID=290309 RepID=UPI00147054CD|nr:BON domain-containing protein [Comamonas granuli]
MPSSRILLAAGMLALTGLTACTSHGMYGTTQHRQHQAFKIDGDTAARVQARIQADNRLPLRYTVAVNAKDGMVELLGEARSAEERQQAEAIASSTYGVTQVKNLMTLRR